MTRKTHEDGFTLIELLAVMLIIGVLGTIIFVSVRPAVDQASATKARADIDSLEQAVEMYRLTLGEYPRELSDLSTAPRDANLAARYPNGGFVKTINVDPWNRDYVYIFPGENGDFDLVSYGRDGEPGGEGLDADITSWGR